MGDNDAGVEDVEENPERPEQDDLQQERMRAQQIHQQLDHIKEWARVTSTEIRTEAEVRFEYGDIDEAEKERMDQVADTVETVYNRIEHGDSNQSRQ